MTMMSSDARRYAMRRALVLSVLGGRSQFPCPFALVKVQWVSHDDALVFLYNVDCPGALSTEAKVKDCF
jgi:hypothetical protein